MRDFLICQRWFASHSGPTFCDRFYALSGRLNLTPDGVWEFDNVKVPGFAKTIFDHLDEQGVSWNYFEDGYCFLRLFTRHTFNNTNIIDFRDPTNGFFAKAGSGALPAVTFIDPHFVELPPGANADGPPADIKNGQELVREVVEAVITGPKWNNTLLIITYDEHGGFYDHVAPASAVTFSDDSPFNVITTYGVRVPAFIISPWVSQGKVVPVNRDDTTLYFDHTSILKTIAARFMTSNPPYMGRRYEHTNDLSAVLDDKMQQTQFLPFIGYNITHDSSKQPLQVGNLAAAQQFSFEDAGNGFLFIRIHGGPPYLTVDVSPTSGGVPTNPGVKQDKKHMQGSAAASSVN